MFLHSLFDYYDLIKAISTANTVEKELMYRYLWLDKVPQTQEQNVVKIMSSIEEVLCHVQSDL